MEIVIDQRNAKRAIAYIGSTELDAMGITGENIMQKDMDALGRLYTLMQAVRQVGTFATFYIDEVAVFQNGIACELFDRGVKCDADPFFINIRRKMIEDHHAEELPSPKAARAQKRQEYDRCPGYTKMMGRLSISFACMAYAIDAVRCLKGKTESSMLMREKNGCYTIIVELNDETLKKANNPNSHEMFALWAHLSEFGEFLPLAASYREKELRENILIEENAVEKLCDAYAERN